MLALTGWASPASVVVSPAHVTGMLAIRGSSSSASVASGAAAPSVIGQIALRGLSGPAVGVRSAPAAVGFLRLAGIAPPAQGEIVLTFDPPMSIEADARPRRMLVLARPGQIDAQVRARPQSVVVVR